MASKANVTLNVLLLTVAIIIANVIRSRVLPISNEIKISLGYSKGPFKNFTQITGKYGYYSEEHTVVTEDGYMLTIFRMNSKRCLKKMRRPPVILMHGLLLSSDAWLDAGPDAGMAFLLADACYDLWVGNQRGNYYARRHVRLNPDTDPDFWQFSVDESGLYDVSATIDYVLKYTNEKTLNYVGYSQGAGTFFVMCSERPGYCDKVDLLVGLAPASRQTHTRSKIYRISAMSIRLFEDLLYTVGVHEFLARGGASQEFLEFFCQLNSISTTICGIGESLFDSFHPGSITNETMAKLFEHFPAGTSVHNMARYGQSMRTSRFQKFDYGKSKNLALYGQNQPPLYNLSAVTTPFLIIYGQNDHLVDTKDIDWLVTKVPNLLEAKLVDDPLWNHFDVAYSQHNRRLVFPKVNEYLLKYSRG